MAAVAVHAGYVWGSARLTCSQTNNKNSSAAKGAALSAHVVTACMQALRVRHYKSFSKGSAGMQCMRHDQSDLLPTPAGQCPCWRAPLAGQPPWLCHLPRCCWRPRCPPWRPRTSSPSPLTPAARGCAVLRPAAAVCRHLLALSVAICLLTGCVTDALTGAGGRWRASNLLKRGQRVRA